MKLFYIAYNILSYPILSYPILSYPILSYPILSYPILSYPILSYHIIPYHIITHPYLRFYQIAVGGRCCCQGQDPRAAGGGEGGQAAGAVRSNEGGEGQQVQRITSVHGRADVSSSCCGGGMGMGGRTTRTIHSTYYTPRPAPPIPLRTSTEFLPSPHLSPTNLHHPSPTPPIPHQYHSPPPPPTPPQPPRRRPLPPRLLSPGSPGRHHHPKTLPRPPRQSARVGTAFGAGQAHGRAGGGGADGGERLEDTDGLSRAQVRDGDGWCAWECDYYYLLAGSGDVTIAIKLPRLIYLP